MNTLSNQSIYSFPLKNPALEQVALQAASIPVNVYLVRGGMLSLTLFIWATLFSLVTWLVGAVLSAETLLTITPLLIIAILTLWAFGPRFEPLPPEEICINKTDFSVLSQLIADLANALDLPMPKVVLTERFVASFGRFGWSNSPVLFLGHSLLSVANRQETMLLIAHELHHVRFSGWEQSRLIKITWDGLERAQYAVSLQWLSPQALEIPLIRIIIAPVTLLLLAFRVLSAIEMRHLEKEADAAALRFCNCKAMETLLKKTAYAFVPPLQRAYDGATPSRKYHAIRAAEAEIDATRFDRLWRSILQAETKLFDKHPSVSERIAAATDPNIVRIRAIIEPNAYRSLQLELQRWPLWLADRVNYFGTTTEAQPLPLRPALEA